MSEKKDFFISYNKADKQNAEWIAWILEDAGYSTVIQAWDFLTGSNFVIEMQKASIESDHTIALLSQAYLNAQFTQPEWAAAFNKDPTGEKGILIPIRVEDFNVPGMLGNIVYIDLVGLDDAEAQKKLLNEIAARVKDTRRKPDKKPLFSPVPKKSSSEPKPAFNPIPVTFARLRLGSTDELVGRQDSLEWLDNKLLKSKGCTCALASLQGMGGMGKTFLSQVFAEKNRENATFLPVYLGETSPFNAGMQLLQKQGIDTSKIDTDEKLTHELQRFYQNGSGILILDDVRTADASLLFPQSDKWSVLITTRDKKLARKLCGDKNVKELDVLSLEDALLLMRKVLENNFRESQIDDYIKLCDYLTCRPYSIRLAAGYLLNALDPDPLLLLERLKAGKPVSVDDDLDFNKIMVLLEDCIDQLEKKSLLAMKLVRALSVGADQGMPLNRFVQWQQSVNGYGEISIERALIAGCDSGLILVENVTDDGKERRILRLHSDILRLLRKEEASETVDSLIKFLDDLLVKRKCELTLDRLMYLQVFALVKRYCENAKVIRQLYSKFWVPLYNTGELKQAFELGEMLAQHIKNNADKDDLQVYYDNQALILSDWGKLKDAMEMHKKAEVICLELGNRDSLQGNYTNQAIILLDWGKTEKAMELLKKVEAIAIECSNRDSLQRSYGNQALILQGWGKLDEAMALHKEEEKICLELGNIGSLLVSYTNQAIILQVWGKLNEAMTLHAKVEKLALEIGDRDSLQKSYGNQAIILQVWGKLKGAMELYKKKESICLELGNRNGLQVSYGNQALVLQTLGRLGEAMELHKKEEMICLELGNRDSLQRCYSNQANILREWGRLDDAMALYKKQELICRELACKDIQISYGGQALVLHTWGKLDQAMELYKKEEDICIKVGHKDGLQTSYGNQALIHWNKARHHEAILLLKKQEKICVEVGLKPSLMRCYRNQIIFYNKMGKKREAEEVLQKLAELEREMGENERLVASD